MGVVRGKGTSEAYLAIIGTWRLCATRLLFRPVYLTTLAKQEQEIVFLPQALRRRICLDSYDGSVMLFQIENLQVTEAKLDDDAWSDDDSCCSLESIHGT